MPHRTWRWSTIDEVSPEGAAAALVVSGADPSIIDRIAPLAAAIDPLDRSAVAAGMHVLEFVKETEE